jgi:hypothetical protein
MFVGSGYGGGAAWEWAGWGAWGLEEAANGALAGLDGSHDQYLVPCCIRSGRVRFHVSRWGGLRDLSEVISPGVCIFLMRFF